MNLPDPIQQMPAFAVRDLVLIGMVGALICAVFSVAEYWALTMAGG